MNTNNTLDLTPHFALDGDQPFKDRRAMMPFRGAIPVAKEQLAQTWQEMINQTVSPRKRLVYLHIPFCATHCTFCGFYQNRFNEDACAHYTDALIREIEREADSVLHQSAPIHAVYFGGGTPSALSAHDLARIITTLREKLPLAPDCEITIEGRVLNFDAERIDACLDAGANRFSIGIQSFNSKIRKKMARTSDGPTAIAFMESLVKRDRAAVVCDLLFGLPGQDAQTWEKIWLLPAISVSTASISMRSMSCPIHRWAKPWKMGVLPCPLRQNVAIFTCKGVILWTMPVGAASVTATGAVPHANAISITC